MKARINRAAEVARFGWYLHRVVRKGRKYQRHTVPSVCRHWSSPKSPLQIILYNLISEVKKTPVCLDETISTRGHFIRTFNNAATPAYQTAHWKKKHIFFQLIKRFNLKYLSCSGKSQIPLLWLPAQASSGCVLICTAVCSLYSAGLGLVTTTFNELLLCAKHYSKHLVNSSERDKGTISPWGSSFLSNNK